ncbi:MAG: sirohydrochlorin cobaltochelatase [Lentilactobacillus diolivorans]|jgi:sirohydrochlorin cobaltochelatase|uniref:sirohydrochlorin cobaltochelatase n=1 Tax=Lentilactobacillus diolivorans TaxID=179838 RepID=UPI000FEDD569|nr:sirohydrochlorin cobaltochelatase [Lentilactobacillus diolivorans]MCH4164727.1 sirohydrochlorin cobaltochelatase [Lentilactobacillus diolivorans]MDH5105154.1 sirohydrochlorin cobaltochelatase [Lentilactobacillus diolivorans]RRG02494.1 MAG: sirohydrochlorin cobaltochelatase [Lactobacillus sp.]
MNRVAVLVVSFGTTYPQTRQKTIEATENAFRTAFPNTKVFRAFTSNVVISRIKAHEGLQIDTPEEALDRIKDEGFDTVYVQSLHMIPGIEYHRLLQQVAKVRDRFSKVVVGKPMLVSYTDYVKVINFLRGVGGTLADNEAVLFMGHGTSDRAFTAYACLDHMLMGSQHYLGAVESYPDIQFEINRLKKDGITRVRLQPFMLVAGNHAHQDMASDKPTSWKRLLEASGIQVDAQLKGMGEYPFIQQQFIEHLKKQLKEVK